VALLKLKIPSCSVTPNLLVRISITASGSLAIALAFSFLYEMLTAPLIVLGKQNPC
jgi:hypothetical protein